MLSRYKSEITSHFGKGLRTAAKDVVGYDLRNEVHETISKARISLLDSGSYTTPELFPSVPITTNDVYDSYRNETYCVRSAFCCYFLYLLILSRFCFFVFFLRILHPRQFHHTRIAGSDVAYFRMLLIYLKK